MKKYWILAGVLTLGAGVLVWGVGQGWLAEQRDQVSIGATADQEEESVSNPISQEQADSELADLLGIQKSELGRTGGISRSKRDMAFGPDNFDPKRPCKTVFPNPGPAPFLSGNENSQVASLIAEFTNQDKEERDSLRVAKTTFFAPKHFDREKYDAAPKAYLAKIRPGRVFQPAQPAPDVKQLTEISPAFNNTAVVFVVDRSAIKTALDVKPSSESGSPEKV